MNIVVRRPLGWKDTQPGVPLGTACQGGVREMRTHSAFANVRRFSSNATIIKLQKCFRYTATHEIFFGKKTDRVTIAG